MSKADIQAREKEWLEAFNGGDASAVTHLYAQGARLMPPNADTLEGRSAIEPFFKGFLETGAKLSFELVTVHESANMCAAVGRYTLNIPGMPTDRGKFIEVWTWQSDGVWRIADDMFNSDLPVPA